MQQCNVWKAARESKETPTHVCIYSDASIFTHSEIPQIEELETDGLVISTGKTRFVVSNAEAKRLLKEALPVDGPQVHDVMRDSGCDCTSGRLRRIMTMKSRRTKGGQKQETLDFE